MGSGPAWGRAGGRAEQQRPRRGQHRRGTGAGGGTAHRIPGLGGRGTRHWQQARRSGLHRHSAPQIRLRQARSVYPPPAHSDYLIICTDGHAGRPITAARAGIRAAGRPALGRAGTGTGTLRPAFRLRVWLPAANNNQCQSFNQVNIANFNNHFHSNLTTN